MKHSLAFCLVFAPLGACAHHSGDPPVYEGAFASHGRNIEVVVDPQAVLLPPPPFTNKDIFPCVECHDPDFLEPDAKRRDLGEPHDGMFFNHAGERIWCLDCHDTEDGDLLRLSDGTTIDLIEAPRLCGQCHGMHYRDWQAGVHGLRTGHWDGAKEFLPCSSCHNAHDPLFGGLEPLAPPTPPEVTR